MSTLSQPRPVTAPVRGLAPLRVLHVYKDYPPVHGGIEHHIRSLAEAQVQGGMDVTVLVTAQNGSAGRAVERGVDVIRARKWLDLFSTPLSTELLRWQRRLPADIVHLHAPYPLGEFAHVMTRNAAPLVVTYHADVVRHRIAWPLYRPVLREILSRAFRIIVSNPCLPQTSALLAPMEAKCCVVPFGVDSSAWANPDPEQVRRIRDRWGGGRRLVLFVGRLRAYKGLEYLIDAMGSTDCSLLVVGDGPRREVLERQARASSAHARIHWAGEAQDDALANYYAAADLFVLPSSDRGEAFGLAMLEAMSAGTPAVCTELATGTSWVNRAGETGAVVPPRDSAALASAITRLLSDDNLRLALGRGARERANSTFSTRAMVDGVDRVYRAAVGHEGRH